MGIKDFMFSKKQDEAAEQSQEMMNSNLGKGGIGEFTKRTSSFSSRARDGKIDVIRKDCPFCHHHKAIKNDRSGIIKCSRCKREIYSPNKRSK